MNIVCEVDRLPMGVRRCINRFAEGFAITLNAISDTARSCELTKESFDWSECTWVFSCQSADEPITPMQNLGIITINLGVMDYSDTARIARVTAGTIHRCCGIIINSESDRRGSWRMNDESDYCNDLTALTQAFRKNVLRDAYALTSKKVRFKSGRYGYRSGEKGAGYVHRFMDDKDGGYMRKLKLTKRLDRGIPVPLLRLFHTALFAWNTNVGESGVV